MPADHSQKAWRGGRCCCPGVAVRTQNGVGGRACPALIQHAEAQSCLLPQAENPSQCYATNFLEGDLNEAATAADASRDSIWQGNCDVADLQLRSNIAPIRNTIPIQYPISNCPAKKGFLQVAVSKARRAAVSLTPPPDFRRRASDTALRLRGRQGLHFDEQAVRQCGLLPGALVPYRISDCPNHSQTGL